VEPLRKLLASPSSSAVARTHGLWALERLASLDDALVERLAHDANRLVRVHVMKVLAERSWETSPLALGALSDPDAFVRRAGADALGPLRHMDHVKPLLTLWAPTVADDTHLIHVARMALRDQLLKPGLYAQISAVIGDNRADHDRLANVSLGVPNAD